MRAPTLAPATMLVMTQNPSEPRDPEILSALLADQLKRHYYDTETNLRAVMDTMKSLEAHIVSIEPDWERSYDERVHYTAHRSG